MPFAKVNGVRMYYEVAGAGPPLVLLPPLPGYKEACELLKV